MPHDKIRAVARKRMAETGEPYTAARRADVSEHQGAGAGDPPPGAGYALRMSGEIHDWLTDLRRSRPQEAAQAARKLAGVHQQAAEARRLLPRMIEARRRLRGQNQQLQARLDAARTRKEALKASHGRLGPGP